MKPIELLRKEHCLLGALLGALEVLLGRTRREDALDTALAVELLELFEGAFDGLHQEREERVLFPWIRARAPQVLRPTIAGLLREHGHERALLDALRGPLEAAAYGDAWSRDRFVTCGEAYLALQRAHLAHEDAWLMPLAEALLDPGDDPELQSGFDALERAAPAPDAHGLRGLRERVDHARRGARLRATCCC